MMKVDEIDAGAEFLKFTDGKKFSTILADPPWQFENRTGKVAPEHKRLSRYPTLSLEQIKAIPVSKALSKTAHIYLWVPNALLAEGIEVLKHWGFTYKTNLIWYKVRKDGGPDRRGVGFYFRNVTEVILFGVRGPNPRTLQPGRSQENILVTQKREHSRKPDEQYALIESCSPGPFLEMFGRGNRAGWVTWGNQAEEYYPEWDTYGNHSQKDKEKSVESKPLALVVPEEKQYRLFEKKAKLKRSSSKQKKLNSSN